MVFKENKWTLLATALLTIFVFVMIVNVMAYQNRVITIETEERARAEALLAQQQKQKPVEQVVEPIPEPQTYLYYYVRFTAPEEVGVERLQEDMKTPIQIDVKQIRVLEGEKVYFRLQVPEETKIASVRIEQTGETLLPLEESEQTPVYRINNISSPLSVVIEPEQEEIPVAPAPAPAPSEPATITFVQTITKPTCTEPGFRWNQCLEDPGRSFQDAYKPPLGHNFQYGTCTRCGAKDPNYKETWNIEVHEVTCEQDGYTLHICNENPSKNYKDSIVKAPGHNFVDGVCTRCGQRKGY